MQRDLELRAIMVAAGDEQGKDAGALCLWQDKILDYWFVGYSYDSASIPQLISHGGDKAGAISAFVQARLVTRERKSYAAIKGEITRDWSDIDAI